MVNNSNTIIKVHFLLTFIRVSEEEKIKRVKRDSSSIDLLGGGLRLLKPKPHPCTYCIDLSIDYLHINLVPRTLAFSASSHVCILCMYMCAINMKKNLAMHFFYFTYKTKNSMTTCARLDRANYFSSSLRNNIIIILSKDKQGSKSILLAWYKPKWRLGWRKKNERHWSTKYMRSAKSFFLNEGKMFYYY